MWSCGGPRDACACAVHTIVIVGKDRRMGSGMESSANRRVPLLCPWCSRRRFAASRHGDTHGNPKRLPPTPYPKKSEQCGGVLAVSPRDARQWRHRPDVATVRYPEVIDASRREDDGGRGAPGVPRASPERPRPTSRRARRRAPQRLVGAVASGDEAVAVDERPGYSTRRSESSLDVWRKKWLIKFVF